MHIAFTLPASLSLAVWRAMALRSHSSSDYVSDDSCVRVSFSLFLFHYCCWLFVVRFWSCLSAERMFRVSLLLLVRSSFLCDCLPIWAIQRPPIFHSGHYFLDGAWSCSPSLLLILCLFVILKGSTIAFLILIQHTNSFLLHIKTNARVCCLLFVHNNNVKR